jgi:hypothetical protein
MDARHHHAHAPAVILVPVPVPYEVETPAPEAGSPKIGRIMKPRYPSRPDRPEPWRPAQRPPRRLTKAERLARFLDAWRKQDNDIRAYMEAARRQTA